MSTVSVSNIKNASSSVNNAVTTSGGDLTNAAGVSFMGGSKNLLYNGAMQVAQRGTSTASITTDGYYTADRWKATFATLGTWTQSVETDAPTGSGLRKSLKMLCTTADAAPSAGDLLIINQPLEGQDVQRVAKGTASAQQLTLSFWVKANVTGTYVCELVDGDNSRGVSATYSVSASATWEKKTITFPADTTGAFDNDNGGSLTVSWWLGAGTTFTSGTLATTWASLTSANRAVGQTNLAAATNNYWQVTGVQLEVGPVASSFEFKSFGQELRECQRYFESSYDVSNAIGTATRAGAVHITSYANTATTYNNSCGFRFITPKRASPTITGYDPDVANTTGKGRADGPSIPATQGNITFNSPASTGVASVTVDITGRTAGAPVGLIFHYTASSEL